MKLDAPLFGEWEPDGDESVAVCVCGEEIVEIHAGGAPVWVHASPNVKRHEAYPRAGSTPEPTP